MPSVEAANTGTVLARLVIFFPRADDSGARIQLGLKMGYRLPHGFGILQRFKKLWDFSA
jgi:hypothetical protein